MSQKGRLDLYAWTSPAHPHLLKIGETIKQTVDERISQTDTTGLAGKPVKVWEYDGTNLSKKYKKKKNLDKFIHNHLSNKGYKRPRNNREFFEITLSELKAEINELEIGVCRPDTYSMRDPQSAGVDFTEKCFVESINNEEVPWVLWNCKMRFGKTFTVYQLCKRMKLKKVLVITYKPAIEDSWRKDLENHVDFDGWEYHYIKEDKKNINRVSKNKTLIAFGSFQDAIGKVDNDTKQKWKNVYDVDWDLVVIDEVHYGASTEKAKEIINNLKFKYGLNLSGTPLKMLMSGEYDDSNTYTYTYIDEQKQRNEEKKNGWKTETYRWLPQLNMYSFSVGEKVLKDIDLYSPEEGITLNKFFGADNNDTLNNEAAVISFLDNLAAEDGRVFQSPFNNNKCRRHLNHMFWLLPGVKSVKALAKLLTDHWYFKQFRIVVAADDNDGKGRDTLNLVRNNIKKYPRTITLSCGKLNTGVTVPEWNSVWLLDDSSSPQEYWQTVFRCQSPNQKDKKENCFVFDFNPNRMLSMIYEFCQYSSKKGQSTPETVRQFLDTVKLFSYNDNQLEKLTKKDFENLIIGSLDIETTITKFSSSRMINANGKLSPDIIDIINSISGKGKISFKQIITDSGIPKGKNFKKSKGHSKKSTDLDDNKNIKLIIEKLNYLTQMIPTVLFVGTKMESCSDIIEKFPEKDFLDIVSISKDNFKLLIDNNIIKEDMLNKAIESFNLKNHV